jgi:hypothetical protein
MKGNKLAIIVSLTMLGSCAFAPDRSFLEEMDRPDDAFFVAGEDFDSVPGDSARVGRSRSEVWERTPKDKRQIASLQEKQYLSEELSDLESRQSSAKWNQYQRVKKRLGSTSEQIYFLKIPSLQERAAYLNSRGINKRGPMRYTSTETVEAIRNRDILLGMSKADVIKAWGRPDRIDVAGNPAYENERWAYSQRGERRVIFFESGKVEGWR